MENKLPNVTDHSHELFDEQNERMSEKIEIITITDTHNDYEAIIRNLRIHDIIDENGEWKEGVKNIHVIHTGDVVNKKNPDKKSLEYIFHLKATAPKTCSVEILAGNHEMDYLMGKTGPAEEGSERKIIEGMSLLSSAGPVLFLHGYPTRKLLRWIESYTITDGYSVEEAIAEINRQFSEALEESTAGYNNKLSHFLFGDTEEKKKSGAEKENKKLKLENRKIIEDDVDTSTELPNGRKLKPLFRKTLPIDYYQKHGKEVSELLSTLGFDVVIHGHVRSPRGVQSVGEFKEFLPNVTLISNDVAVSDFKSTKVGEPTAGNKWGSTKIIMENNSEGKTIINEMTFVNKDTVEQV